MFLDIDIPGVNGMEAVRLLREQSEDVIIVFVTAFAEYALEGYWVGAMLYLLNPWTSSSRPVLTLL